MEWTELAVVIGCALAGFTIVNAVIDARRSKKQQEEGNPNADSNAQRERANQQDSRGEQATKEEDVPRSWWEVLNVDRGASLDQVKEAFRREITKYHPDRVEGLGIELRELAERKAKEVNCAYTNAKEQWRFR